MTSILTILFWLSIAGVAYAYAAYPVLITILAKLFGHVRECDELPDERLPSVTVLIAAHNEEEVIHNRVVNALAMDYPSDRLEIVIASDGSLDRTAEIVRAFGSQVRLLDYPARRGKSATLNAAVAELSSEVIVLSDANTMLDASACRKLARWFRDSTVGAVCGRLEILDPASGLNVDGAYWKYETFLKVREDRLGALLGSNGAIYAIRRDLYQPIPANTIVDDFVIPLRARIRTNCRIIYDREARGTEEAAPELRDEFRRRIRIGAGGFQAVGLLWRLLSPRFGWTAFTFASHKICRWLCPMFLAIAVAASFILGMASDLYRDLFTAQVAFYALALLAMLVPGSARVLRPLRLASMFVSMNAALLLGFFRWVRGTQQGIWQRTQRVANT